MRKSETSLQDALGATVLHLRKRSATSRSTLARALAVAASTSSYYIDWLIDHDFVAESGLDQGRMGRPQRALTLRSEAGWFAGVEFHGAAVQAARVDFAGNVFRVINRPLPADADAAAVIESVATAVEELQGNGRGRLLALGVGAPGMVDPESGRGREYRFISDWRDVAISQTLRGRFGAPVALEHNMRAIALGERWFGGGKTLRDYVCLALRTGVGAGIVSAGKLVTGSHAVAGEIGRWPWPSGSRGALGELQERLSAPAIYRRIHTLRPDNRLPANLALEFAKHAKLFAGDAPAGREWQEVIHDLAQAATCLRWLLDPEVLFLHGPLAVLGEGFCKRICQKAREFAGDSANNAREWIQPTSLGDNAGALGAAGLAMESWQPSFSAARKRGRRA